VTLEEMREIVSHITYPGFQFHVDIPNGDSTPSLRVGCRDGVCNVTGEPWPWYGRWWRLSTHATESEIVGTCYQALDTAMRHEMAELFRYHGLAVYNQHRSVRALMEIADKEDRRENH
jgi:hypothetical protein